MKKPDTTTAIKTTTPIHGIALVENPELITVRTISPRICDQLPYLDASPAGGEGRTDYDGVEMIGADKYGTVIVRDETGKLGKVRALALIMWQMSKHGATNAEAHVRLRAIPAIFEV